MNENRGVFIESMFKSAKLVKNARNKFGVNYMVISGLEEGQYHLWLKKENVRIVFNVVSGKHWQFSGDFILSERSVMERTHQPRLDSLRFDEIAISYKRPEDAKFVDGKKMTSIKVTLGGEYNPKSARIHVWAFNFNQCDLTGALIEKFNHSGKTQVLQTAFPFKQWKNMFMNNRVMGDENRYIFERKL